MLKHKRSLSAGDLKGQISQITQHEKNRYLLGLKDLVDDAVGNEPQRELADLIQHAEKIIKQHGENVLKSILNMHCEDLWQESLLAMASNSHKTAIEMQLIAYGAKNLDMYYLTPTQAAIIFAGIAKKLGDTFNPIIFTPDDDTQLRSISDYLTRQCDNMLSLKNKFLTVYKTVIIADSQHWSTCQIQFKVIRMQPHIRMYFVDGIGLSYFGYKEYDLILTLANFFEQHKISRSKICIYRSRLPLQKDSRSCRAYAITFTRMLHSMLHGKFRHGYDLFDDIENSPYSKERVVQKIEGVTFIDLPQYLPTKMLQTSQYIDQERNPREHQILVSRAANVVNSKGLKLGEALDDCLRADVLAKKTNDMILTKYRKLLAQSKNMLAHDLSADIRLHQIRKLQKKYFA